MDLAGEAHLRARVGGGEVRKIMERQSCRAECKHKQTRAMYKTNNTNAHTNTYVPSPGGAGGGGGAVDSGSVPGGGGGPSVSGEHV